MHVDGMSIVIFFKENNKKIDCICSVRMQIFKKCFLSEVEYLDTESMGGLGVRVLLVAVSGHSQCCVTPQCHFDRLPW